MFDAENCFTLQTDGTYVQAITTSTVSTNVIDLGAAAIDLANPARPMFLIVRVTVLGTGITTSLEVKLENHTAENMSGAKEIMTFDIPAASLIAGAVIVNSMIPVGIYERYLRLDFDMIGGDSTITLFAALSDAPETAKAIMDLIEA